MSILLHPHHYDPTQFDPETRRLLTDTVKWFERRGLDKLLEDFHNKTYYTEFLEFLAKEKVLATFLTPAQNADGNPAKRWDSARISALSEITGFYGLDYWYPYQVTILGLGPVWQSENAAARKRAASALEAGGSAHSGSPNKRTAPTSIKPTWSSRLTEREDGARTVQSTTSEMGTRHHCVGLRSR